MLQPLGAAGSISTFSLFQEMPSNLKAGERNVLAVADSDFTASWCRALHVVAIEGEFNIYKCAPENTIMSKFEAHGPIKMWAMIALVNFILCDWSKRAI